MTTNHSENFLFFILTTSFHSNSTFRKAYIMPAKGEKETRYFYRINIMIIKLF
jgi:hypothetical protein